VARRHRRSRRLRHLRHPQLTETMTHTVTSGRRASSLAGPIPRTSSSSSTLA
jgi:hypothetical protein